jgi:hypothetical protein
MVQKISNNNTSSAVHDVRSLASPDNLDAATKRAKKLKTLLNRILPNMFKKRPVEVNTIEVRLKEKKWGERFYYLKITFSRELSGGRWDDTEKRRIGNELGPVSSQILLQNKKTGIMSTKHTAPSDTTYCFFNIKDAKHVILRKYIDSFVTQPPDIFSGGN